MQASDVPRAVDAAISTASALDLTVDHAIVLNDSNRLALHLLPCDVLARVAHAGSHVAEFEVELARLLAETDSPVGVLEPRVDPRTYECDGFVVTLWTFYETTKTGDLSAGDYANALERLHASVRELGVPVPHFTDRVAEAELIVASPEHSPALADADRELLVDTLRTRRQTIVARRAPEQLLHGEPHPGNVLNTQDGPLFIDLETCCRGPVEFDLAHVPEEVSKLYPAADPEMLQECGVLALAMVAAWRSDVSDRLPDGERALRELLSALREGPPWPALDAVMRRASR